MTLKPPLLLIAWLLLFGWGNALGQAKTITDPSSLVSLGSTARYSDPLKRLFPDLSTEDYSATQTIAGGEVTVLDSAGYGPVAVTQPVSIVAAKSQRSYSAK